jgi:(1->4)-alpha-D-glucan 1-alpha-D-glucosylmutase
VADDDQFERAERDEGTDQRARLARFDQFDGTDRIWVELREELARGAASSRRPASTYRLQLTPNFGFRQAAEVVPYLHSLGVTDVYLSPILAAAPGSQHGYDVVDQNALSPELGGEAGYQALCAALASRGMGQLVDFVPNHMGIGPTNALWMDLLENGPSSVTSAFFDVDWKPVKDELDDKVLVPVLGDQYGRVLEAGELKLTREGGAFTLRYYDHRFPIAPRAVPQILRHGLEAFTQALGAGDVHLQELESIVASLEKLTPRSTTDPEKVLERAREKEVAKRRLAALIEASPRIGRFVDDNVAAFNGRPGDPRSFDQLHGLLEHQAYRLAHWRVAGEEINYRRFFDVNGLAAIRMEDPRVFDQAHRLVLRLVAEGKINGLRIDHPDGLYDPTSYFRRLQASYLTERGRRIAARLGLELRDDQAGALRDRLLGELAQGKLPPRPLYVVAEKILGTGERMPEVWAIDGTTGYEFLAVTNGLFVDTSSARAFDDLTARFTGRREPYRDVVYGRKRLVMSSSMSSEINMLARRLNRISETNRRTRDFTLNELTRALVEFVALFPVYRTYVTPEREIDARDRQYIEATVARAKRRSPVTDPSIYDFLRDVLLLHYPDGLSEAEQRDWLELTLKLQQITGPVTAKAIEDTTFYVFNRLVSLNEVGGEPREFGATPEVFHELAAQRLARWPASLSATSTHDTKRSEDVRVRIDALSEIPGQWRTQLSRWARLNRRHRTQVDGVAAPDRSDELLLYQTLVGAWPDDAGTPAGRAAFTQRIGAYMAKAIREAKVHTSWTNVDVAYEAAVQHFVEAVLSSPAFLEELVPFVRWVAAAGRLSSLAQVALKCAAPGVCDVYQGCELWDLSLVDPDNRRPIDWGLRAAMLDELTRRAAAPEDRAALAREVSTLRTLSDGRAKLLLLSLALRLRRDQPDLFLAGEHLPLQPEGKHAAHVLAFARRSGTRALVCVVPRLVLRLLEQSGGAIGWEGRLPLPPELAGRYRDLVTGAVHTGAPLDLGRCFGDFPVALLWRED